MISSKKISIDQIESSSLTTTASFNAFTASYNTGSFTGSFTGSLLGTSSYALNGLSSSFASTASFAPNYTLTSSFNNFTGSYNTGSFTGSFTGSLFGTSSFAVSSSQAVTASYALTGGDTTERYTDTFTATQGQTVFIATQPLISGYYDVYLNGVRLNDTSYTATEYTITLIDQCISGDIVDIISYQLVRIGSRETRRNVTDSVNENTNYCGTAPAGSLENQNVWTIFKIVVALDGSVTRTFATNVAWTDREIVIYN